MSVRGTGCRWVSAMCPGWGSNPHWEVFKTSSSAIGIPGPPRRYRATAQARHRRASSTSSLAATAAPSERSCRPRQWLVRASRGSGPSRARPTGTRWSVPDPRAPPRSPGRPPGRPSTAGRPPAAPPPEEHRPGPPWWSCPRRRGGRRRPPGEQFLLVDLTGDEAVVQAVDRGQLRPPATDEDAAALTRIASMATRAMSSATPRMLPNPTYTGGCAGVQEGHELGRERALVGQDPRAGPHDGGVRLLPRAQGRFCRQPWTVGEHELADVLHRWQVDRRPMAVDRRAEQGLPVAGRPGRSARSSRRSRTRAGCPASPPPTGRRSATCRSPGAGHTPRPRRGPCRTARR